MSNSKPKLELVALKKEYENGSVVAVDSIDLSVFAGETLALLGSSGCGKSTTLNMIVGLEHPTSGDIQIDGKSVTTVPAGKRNVGLVFQDYAVFTSMTVRKNLAFGLKVRGVAKDVIGKAVDETAELLGMKHHLDTPAAKLGGSELQRVAIGRTLVTKPDILLLDEPLSNLEAAARLAMRKELRRLQSEIGLTIIYVTHDQVEAFSLADRIAVMHLGKIVQIEKTTRICEQPDHLFVAGFLGSPPMNLLAGTIVSGDQEAVFRLGDFQLNLGKMVTASDFGRDKYTLGIRPQAIRLVEPGNGALIGRIAHSEPMGSETIIAIETPLFMLNAVHSASKQPREGEAVGIDFDLRTFALFDNETNRRVRIDTTGA